MQRPSVCTAGTAVRVRCVWLWGPTRYLVYFCVFFFFQVTMNLKLYFGVVLILASIYGTSFTFVVSCKCFSLGSYIFWLTIQNSVDSIHKISFEQTATKQPHNKFSMAKAPFRKIRELFFATLNVNMSINPRP